MTGVQTCALPISARKKSSTKRKPAAKRKKPAAKKPAAKRKSSTRARRKPKAPEIDLGVSTSSTELQMKGNRLVVRLARDDHPEIFELDRPSPYMLLVAPVREDRRKPMTEEESNLFGIAKLNVPRSDVPAITHVDYSARVQTVSAEDHPEYHELISAFKDRTGYGVIVNTSFNVRGEPIVCTPQDAYRCFMRTEMDVLFLENLILYKEEQPELEDDVDWREEFELD